MCEEEVAKSLMTLAWMGGDRHSYDSFGRICVLPVVAYSYVGNEKYELDSLPMYPFILSLRQKAEYLSRVPKIIAMSVDCASRSRDA